MLSLDSETALDDLDELDVAVVFKHSTQCPISSNAHREVEGFARDNPDIPVYRILVIEQRSISNAIAERSGIPHASPQILIFKRGSLVSDASHFQITQDALDHAIGTEESS